MPDGENDESLKGVWSSRVLITEVSAVIIAITGPVVRDAAPTDALELGVGAGMDAARFVAAVSTVVL
ncbi:hypothetical protein EYF80_001088 [Liparis tanakae]|uniref:Uncharacterized protein n=1 Tax=Liparis tanakae TaxID=230148 RepID=A0A4Z2JET7_9TELE|nr:hypothetical protein EYF80_001088 [Liparis tanakae]